MQAKISASPILISSLPGSALKTHVKSRGFSTSVLKAFPGKLDIERILPSILLICLIDHRLAMEQVKQASRDNIMRKQAVT